EEQDIDAIGNIPAAPEVREDEDGDTIIAAPKMRKSRKNDRADEETPGEDEDNRSDAASNLTSLSVADIRKKLQADTAKELNERVEWGRLFLCHIPLSKWSEAFPHFVATVTSRSQTFMEQRVDFF
ncbi:unnamed protein product, partial [Amoebophrya sp. A25]